MRDLSATVTAALEGRTLVARDFLWLVGRNRETGEAHAEGLWSDVDDISTPVVNPDSGSAETRNWQGSGTLVTISDIPAVSTVTVQNVSIALSQIDNDINRIVRQYDLKQARVEIYRGYFDPDSRALVDAAPCRFVGFVDKVDITNPKEGDAGACTLTCASHTQEMTRSNPDTRSDVSQQLRAAGDSFYVDATAIGDLELYWGRNKLAATSSVALTGTL